MKLLKLLFLGLVFAAVPAAYAGTVIYPCNSAPAIAVKNGNVRVLYKRSGAAPIDSIVLSGPYQRVKAAISNPEVRSVVWDQETGAAYDLAVTLTVPASAPADLYDLLVYSAGGIDTSHHTLKVVSGFSSPFSFMHITDTHAGREWGNGYGLELQYTSRLVRLANILGIEFVVNTGDLIMDYSLDNGYGTPADAAAVWSNFFNGGGGFAGMRGLNVPLFLTPGNHDYRDENSMADEWNVFCGLRSYGFRFGETRFLSFDAELANDYPVTQTDSMASFLAREGAGRMRVAFIHNRTYLDDPFCNTHRIALALAGHSHANGAYTAGTTPTRVLETGSAGHFGYVGVYDVGWFRYITLQDSQIIETPPLQYGNPVTQVDSLTLSFANPNTGDASVNSATLVNRFHAAFPGCRVRFVMAKGAYTVQNGTVEQVIENDTVSVYDVRVNAPSAGTVTVNITPGGTRTTGALSAVSYEPVIMLFPNPASSSVRVFLQDPRSGLSGMREAVITICNPQGAVVRSMKTAAPALAAGLVWDSSELKNGVYVVSVSAGTFRKSARVTLLK